MKIAYIITGLKFGGAEVQLATVCNEIKLNHKSHEVKVFVLSEHDDLIYRFNGTDVTFCNLKKVSGFTDLYSKLKLFSPDVIHSHMIHANIISPMLAFFVNSTCFITSHNTNEGSYFRIKLLKLICKIFSPHVSHVSKKGIQSYLEKNVSKEVLLYINPIDLRKFVAKSNGRNNDVVWINVASLTHQKRHDRLINVFAEFSKLYPNDILKIVGEGPLLSECEALIESKGLSKKVFLEGRRSDIPDLLYQSDYFVLSSDWEGLPVAIIESLSTGTPVIATRCGDVDTVIVEQFNGYLSDAGDDKALLDSMVKARSISDEEYSSIANNSKCSVQKFSSKEIVNNLLEMYREHHVEKV
nr:glycosyltransferase [Vibrio parahaemolyticus]